MVHTKGIAGTRLLLQRDQWRQKMAKVLAMWPDGEREHNSERLMYWKAALP